MDYEGSALPSKPGMVIDTCCLFPQYLRDLLLTAASLDLLAPNWSQRILDELARNLIERYSDDSDRPMRVERLITQMNLAFPEALVDASIWEPYVEQMTNHPKDRHVLAVAVGAGIPFLLTENVRDFPRPAAEKWNIQVLHPDEFLVQLYQRREDGVEAALEQMRKRYVRRQLTRTEIVERIGVKAPSFARLIL
ncbi:MAG TPA: PIN domain-containing protein [Chloroflexota bacterium]|nr:PIN domain-containing protein [Chloroflexota bacterium]